ncbi:syntaxin-16-like isoform X2 [Bolinopsis microptera]|uniref:syntaxin-16-like isoform X2 n=1 Tax=Bolinopsis microptera TaxID=2820187 RepID=UPI003078C9A0
MSGVPKFPLVTTDHWNLFSKERNRSAKRRLQGPVSYRQDDSGGDVDTLLNTDSERGDSSAILPPAFTDELTSIEFEMSDIRRKMTHLESLHGDHLRNAFDDDREKENEIEILTKQITRGFHKCQNSIKLIGQRARNSSTQQLRMATNIMSSLASTLQEESSDFKKLQSDYLNRLKGREERERMLGVGDDYQDLFGGDDDQEYIDSKFTNQQIQMVEQNSRQVEQRDEEIRRIVESIAELQSIFSDLAGLVADQGTVLDRIDYNMEQTVVKVEDGYQELIKAEKHQKRGRKCIFIIFLALVILCMVVALFATKFKK